mmetsp:Transcript_20337/g.24377  ORF Transcript_20337/g.24377 Transcript_20337/m.24377 type:complete len:829 (-) Transcript_20337:430-2916(-)|eukprot:CAMPEP_0197848772 /NCGR_PEP_ID=MMETSP1438-20131217/10000_1 /TAXON_ID=1461541 /ORGANISM="Pterosperma sp., Strain CCMP1384" /LENGTH=828 /DNA_ID=CAMNT_0043461179 /DNA_START=115 /DNA_END=2601 /DNA_ORIENTATION=+
MSRSYALSRVAEWTRLGLSNGSVGTQQQALLAGINIACRSGIESGFISNIYAQRSYSHFTNFSRTAEQVLREGVAHTRRSNVGSLPAITQVKQAAQQTIRRSFSSGGPNPKKGYEHYFPKKQRTSTKGETRQSKGEETPKGAGGKKGDKKEGDNFTPEDWSTVGGLTVALGLVYLLVQEAIPQAKGISFQEFKTKLLEPGYVEKIEVVDQSVAKVYLKNGVTSGDASGPTSGHKYYFNIGSVQSFENKLEDAQDALGIDPHDYLPVTYERGGEGALGTVVALLPYLMLGAFLLWLRNGTSSLMNGVNQQMGRGRGIFDAGKASVTKYDPNAKDKVLFKDVAGCDEAKVEVMEFVHFLKNPDKYKELGASIPKGALLVGPPGTGKTLLAKATAGEAEVPFLSISGSDFMEMYVGVGPARVRNLFSQAREQSPSIIFIDEIDAVGRARGGGAGRVGGNDERENTLNQLLVEMDGFATTTGVVVLAGTNRPDVLDKALLRPGRFDRQITIDHPDVKGRKQIFMVHLKKLKLEKEMEYYAERLAALTPGFAGADIANVCNEAALVAARHLKATVDMKEFEHAIDRTIGGLEKKNKTISKEERRTVAFHEAGHAVVGWFLEHTHPLLKVSIVPRGTAALGFAQYLPSENMLHTEEHIADNICMTLGGRAAEEVMLGKISSGAQNDLEKVTQMAYNQVSVLGMNKKIGLLSFPRNNQEFNKPYSQDTSQMIDSEVRLLVDGLYDRTKGIIEEKKDLIEKMALALLDREVLNLEEIVEILGERPFVTEEMRNIDRYRQGFAAETVEETDAGEVVPEEDPLPGKEEPALASKRVDS